MKEQRNTLTFTKVGLISSSGLPELLKTFDAKWMRMRQLLVDAIVGFSLRYSTKSSNLYRSKPIVRIETAVQKTWAQIPHSFHILLSETQLHEAIDAMPCQIKLEVPSPCLADDTSSIILLWSINKLNQSIKGRPHNTTIGRLVALHHGRLACREHLEFGFPVQRGSFYFLQWLY